MTYAIRIRRAPTLLLLLAAAAPAAAQQQRGMLPQDYYRMVDVGDVALSPRGDLVAFTKTTVMEEDNRRHREVWLQRLREGRPEGEPFRFTDPSRESSAPRWSPDGSVLSFQSQRDRDLSSTWFARVTAPGGEAYQVEGVKGAPVWSPDGRWIAFTWADRRDPNARGAASRAGWIAPDAITRTLDAERFDGRVITSERYRSDGTLEYLPHPATVGRRQLYVVPAQGGEPRKLTDLPFDVSDPAWAGEGRTLFFSGDEELDDTDVHLTRDLFAVPAGGGEPRRLTSNPGNESSPAVSPDGRWLAFLSTPASRAETEVMVVEIDGSGSFRGAPRALTGPWTLDPQSPEWSADGRRVRFTAGVGGNSHLFDVPVAGGEVRQITSGERQLGSVSFSADDRLMAYTSTDPDSPEEVFVASGNGRDEQRATSFNDPWLSEVTLMPAERLTWTVGDGTEIEGWVVKPVGYQAGRKYPMVLKIHGGPHGAYGNTFFQTFHVLSNAGMFVLYSNPRGSSGYGNAFEYANERGWGVVDEEDFLKGVDAAVAMYPDIDPERVGVSGGSYGGYATNWLTAHTNRFAAAVTSRSIADLRVLHSNSDAPGGLEADLLVPFWKDRELYERLSPITYVENVTAPTLVIHSENDYRTPLADGEAWYMTLKKLGVPTEFVRYPRSSHGLSRTGEPWLLVDRLERIRSWFSYWLVEHPERLPARRTTERQQR